MNFLKILGLVLGAFSVGGAAAVGIYYADSKNKKSNSIDSKNDFSNSEAIALNGEDAPANAEVDEVPVVSESDVSDSLHANVNSNKDNVQIERIKPAINSKTQFEGKIVFFKKKGSTEIVNYELKIITKSQYETQKNTFNRNKTDQNKYDQVHRVIDVSGKLNSGREKNELKRIFSAPSTSSDIKAKILSEATKLKELFGDAIYENLKNKFNS